METDFPTAPPFPVLGHYPAEFAPPSPLVPGPVPAPVTGPVPGMVPAPVPQSTPARGLSVVFFSPRGGVGTTTLASNLAAFVATTDDGRRRGVALLDLDLPFGTAAAAFGVAPPRTLADLDGHPTPEKLRSVLVPTDAGVHLLAAPTDPLAAEGISTEECLSAMAFATATHGLTVIDSGPYPTETTLAAIDLADVVVVVVSGDVAGIASARAALHTLAMLGLSRRNRMLLAAARMGAPHTLEPGQLAEALGVAPAVVLPESADLALAARRGRLLAQDWPDHTYARAVGALADVLNPSLSTGTEAIASPPRRRRRRWGGGRAKEQDQAALNRTVAWQPG